MKAFLLAILLAGCSSCVSSFPHGFKSDRDYIEYMSSVRIVTKCDDGRLFIGSGFAVSRRHVITARHVMDCGGEWGKALVYQSGDPKPLLMLVDADKGGEVDAVRLVAESNVFRSFVRVSKREPKVGEYVCQVGGDGDLYTNWMKVCGYVAASAQDFIYVSMKAVPGNSGSPVYDEDGLVVGILVRGRFHPYMNSVSLLEASRYWYGLVP